MKLLLTSQGLSNQKIKQAFLNNLPKNPEHIKVAFVTTAAYGEEPNPILLEVYRKELRGCGIKTIEDLDLKGKTKEELEQFLSDKDVIFVNGGNTLYLLKYIRESELNKILPNILRKGTIYVGISAGSYVACPTIEMATWKRQDRNIVALKDFTGLNLVPFLLSAHFEEEYRSIIEEQAKKIKYPLVVLTDQQAILCIDNRCKIVGGGEQLVYNGTIKNLEFA